MVGSNLFSDVEQMLSHAAKKGLRHKAVKISWINCLQILVEIASNAAIGKIIASSQNILLQFFSCKFVCRHLLRQLLNSAVIAEEFLGRSIMAYGALGTTQFANGRSKIHYDDFKINNTVRMRLLLNMRRVLHKF